MKHWVCCHFQMNNVSNVHNLFTNSTTMYDETCRNATLEEAATTGVNSVTARIR